MTKQKQSAHGYITRQILAEEISASEKRLEAKIDSKIDIVGQSLKDYVDSRLVPVSQNINAIDAKIVALDAKIGTMDAKIGTMDAKMTRYFEGIGKMLEGVTGKTATTQERLEDHEQRITALEGRAR